ncbi:hypothetical protein Tco_1332675, partial [Tanacetum coccineum]
GGMGNSRPKGDSGSIWFNILKSVRELDNKNANLDDFVEFSRIFKLDIEVEPRVVDRIHLNPLVNVVQYYALSPQTDRWVWSGDGTGQFSVSSARQIIDRDFDCLKMFNTSYDIVLFSTMANASRSLDKSDMIIPVVGPSQAPNSSIPFPGIKKMSWHHKSDKSQDEQVKFSLSIVYVMMLVYDINISNKNEYK